MNKPYNPLTSREVCALYPVPGAPAVSAMAPGPTDGSRVVQYLGGVAYRLAAGEDPQIILEGLANLLETNEILNIQQVLDTVEALVDLGARAATGEPGCVLERLIVKLQKPQPTLLLRLCEMLQKKPGELAFHTMASHQVWMLSEADMKNPLVIDRLRALDGHGRTVAHRLWAKDGDVAKSARRAMTYTPVPHRPYMVKLWKGLCRNAWIYQGQLDELGVGLDIPDPSGTTALELCMQRIEAGEVAMCPEIDMCARVQAIKDRGLLQSATPKTPATPTPAAPRL